MDADNAADVRWRIGFLPQKPPLYEEMTVRSFLDFAARLRGVTDRVDHRVDEVIEMVDVVPYADAPIGRLSDGYRQRVGIGQAVIHDPALVILDEPTSQLDPAQLRDMRALIRSLKERHTVLLSSHNLPEISQTCDRLLVIHEGQLKASGAEDELRSRMDVSHRFQVAVLGEAKAIESTISALTTEGVLIDAQISAGGDETVIDVMLARNEPHRLARTLIEGGLELTRLQPHEHELESVFLQLTAEAQATEAKEPS